MSVPAVFDVEPPRRGPELLGYNQIITHVDEVADPLVLLKMHVDSALSAIFLAGGDLSTLDLTVRRAEGLPRGSLMLSIKALDTGKPIK